MSKWRPIETLSGRSRDEILVLLKDGTVRTAARGLGTILLGVFGETARPDNWPTHWMPKPPSPTQPSTDTEDGLVERARFLASCQDDPHSVTIDELCDEIERLRAALSQASQGERG